jgi:dipeptidase
MREGLPVGNYGKVIGEIPQVENTSAYFHMGYSQFSEHQLAIDESTLSQKEELKIYYVEGISEQKMTIEQAQVFALERCKTAREAIELITSLVEKYNFLPSCEGGAEALTITCTSPEHFGLFQLKVNRLLQIFSTPRTVQFVSS